MSGTTSRWAGAAGIGFAVLFVAGLQFIQGTPKYDAPASEWQAWFNGSGHRAGQLTGMFLVVAAALLLLAFFAPLLRRVRAAGGSADASAVAGVAGTVLVGAVAASAVVMAAISAAMTFAPDNFPAPPGDIARVVEQLGFGLLLVVGGWAGAVFVAATSRALQATTVVPGWLVSAGYVVAVLLLASVLFVPFLLLALWVLVVGVTLAMGREDRPANRP